MRNTERKRKERFKDSETEQRRENSEGRVLADEGSRMHRKGQEHCGQVHQGQAKSLCPSHLGDKQSALWPDLLSSSGHLSHTASSRRSREDTAEIPRLFR